MAETGVFHHVDVSLQLSPSAWRALATLPSWQWLSRGDGWLMVDEDECGTWVWGSGGYWGLGCWLVQDLALANLVGEVHGRVLTSGGPSGHELELALFEGRGRCLAGSSSCLAVDRVVVRQVAPRTGPAPGRRSRDREPFVALADADGVVEQRDVDVHSEARDECSCGGWDGRRGPRCTGATVGDRAPGRCLTGGVEVLDAVLDVQRAGPVDDVVSGGAAGAGDRAWAQVVAVGRGAPVPVRGREHWQVRWARALGRDDVDVTGYGQTRRGTAAPVARAVLARPTAGSRSGQVLATVVELVRTNPGDTALAGTAAARADLDDDAVRSMALLADPAHYGTLAANRAVSDELVLGLPGQVVAAAAPWRLGDDTVVVEVATQLGRRWPGDARSLLAAAEAAVGDPVAR